MCETLTQCQSCINLKSTLRKAVYRLDKSADQRTSATSHATYHTLTSEEKSARLRDMHTKLKLSKQKVGALERRMSELIRDEGVLLHEMDCDDAMDLVQSVQPLVEEKFPKNTPQRIFWEQQLKCNSMKDKRQMRWHPLVLRFALNLKYLSTSCYKALRQSGLVHLPSERTLSDYTHWTKPHTGVSLEYIEELKRQLKADVQCKQHHCALSMDEMKIKSGLTFDKSSGRLVGFVDLGKVNEEIEAMVGVTESNQKELAKQMFVFMARAVFKPSLSMPVAHYFSNNLKGN